MPILILLRTASFDIPTIHLTIIMTKDKYYSNGMYRFRRRKKYWIISITEENWYVVKENNIYGVLEPSKGLGT